MQTLARFVIRPADEEGRGNLVLGAMFKAQNLDLLSPGKVYEIREVLGTLTIVPVGEANISMRGNGGDVCWNNDVNTILSSGGGRHLLTTQEYAGIGRPLED